jgi:gamma-glutamylcyclotransferase (GGCT)/AIG2-like uncharacterized protein YtfP
MISTHLGESLQQATRLFVYGTLRPGQFNFIRIERFVVACEPATIEGELVDLGAFPALVKGDGIVEGDMLTLQPTALRITDRIESYRPKDRRGLYLRRAIAVTLAEGSKVRAWTYFFGWPERLADYPRALVGHRDGRPVLAWPICVRSCLSNRGQNGSKP